MWCFSLLLRKSNFMIPQEETEAKLLINFMVLNTKIKALKSTLNPEQLLAYQETIKSEKNKF